MDIIFGLLLFFSVVANIALALNLNTKNRLNKELKNRIEKPDAQFQNRILKKKIMLLSRDPDPLSELVRYSTLVHQGHKDLTSKGPEVIDFFVAELENRWQLSQIGTFKLILGYNPDEHRCDELVNPVDKVEIIKPGWKLNGEVIKFASVKKVGGN